MKTCNFRGAYPRLFGNNKDESEGILCQLEPNARFGMIPCCNPHCFLCQSRRGESGQLLNIAVHFSKNQIHHFVNNYKAILNCNAVSTI
jgi:hypothetical protein